MTQNGFRMCTAPIILFVYNRLRHTQRTIEALQKNVLAESTELIIFSDGPKSEADAEKIRSLLKYIKSVNGFKKVDVVERERNLGLAQSILSGVTEVVNNYGRIIVLEDDMVTSPYFLRYMNDALEFYEDEQQVISIHGYIYPVKGSLPETFFLKGADCWGWATWKRGWDLFEPDARKLLDGLKAGGLTHRFDFNGSYSYTKMLEDYVKGKNDSWAIRWYASAFLKGKLTLYPGRSLVFNTGTDASGTHCTRGSMFDTEVYQKQVKITKIPVIEENHALESISGYFRSLKNGPAQVMANAVNRLVKKFRS